jgi:hypothetical protein
MGRTFNTAGPCDPEIHYLLPPEGRLPELRRLIEQRAYFVVHAPRQTGKTTTLRSLARALTAEGRYLAVLASCEMGQSQTGDVEAGVAGLLRSLERQGRLLPPAFPRHRSPSSPRWNRRAGSMRC